MPILGHTLLESIPYAEKRLTYPLRPCDADPRPHSFGVNSLRGERLSHTPRRGADSTACQLVHTSLDSVPYAEEKAYHDDTD